MCRASTKNPEKIEWSFHIIEWCFIPGEHDLLCNEKDAHDQSTPNPVLLCYALCMKNAPACAYRKDSCKMTTLVCFCSPS
ncbi:hypothetical protein SK128_014965, partial [Halocaridina rubra]